MPKPLHPAGTVSSLSRRHFLKYTTLAPGAVLGSAPAILRGQNLNSRLQIAVVGAGGKGSSDTDEAARAGGHIFALCDVDKGTLNARTTSNPKPKEKSYPEAK